MSDTPWHLTRFFILREDRFKYKKNVIGCVKDTSSRVKIIITGFDPGSGVFFKKCWVSDFSPRIKKSDSALNFCLSSTLHIPCIKSDTFEVFKK